MCDAISTDKLTTQFLQFRLRVYSRRRDGKGIKARKQEVCCEIVTPRNVREDTPIYILFDNNNIL